MPRYNNGVVTACGHMVNQPSFVNYDAMMNSEWLRNVELTFAKGEFPAECVRCKQDEDIGQISIRNHSLQEEAAQTNPDYLIAGLTLDNICNGACQFCGGFSSTKIGSLISNNYYQYDNTAFYQELPLERLTHINIAGGEPSNSKNVKHLLKNLPANVKSIRINTNGSSFIPDLQAIIDKDIKISITLSLDGTEKVYEYVRWPIKWSVFVKTVEAYKYFADRNAEMVNLNTWTTVNALNICDLENIINFADSNKISNAFSLLVIPNELNIMHSNILTLCAKKKLIHSNNVVIKKMAETVLATGANNQLDFNIFTQKQDKMRNISISDYITVG